MRYALVHIAGPLVDAIQKCSRCGYVLKDTSWAEVDAGAEASSWAEGSQVAVAEDGHGSRFLWATDFGGPPKFIHVDEAFACDAEPAA